MSLSSFMSSPMLRFLHRHSSEFSLSSVQSFVIGDERLNTVSAVSSRPDQALEALAERGRQLNILSMERHHWKIALIGQASPLYYALSAMLLVDLEAEINMKTAVEDGTDYDTYHVFEEKKLLELLNDLFLLTSLITGTKR